MKAERVQTGVRMEKRLVKVLKALAELRDLSLGDLLEYIVCRAFEGQEAFAADEVSQIVQLMRIYQLDSADCHPRLPENEAAREPEESA
jgi:predicted DNA-binding ribbon-helix-helix protein